MTPEALATPHLPGNGRRPIDPSLWWPIALVLVIEHRICRCGRSYRCPGLAPAVEWAAIYPPHRRQIRAPADADPQPAAGLPARWHTVTTPITACPGCFSCSGPDTAQPSLFPPPPQPPARPIPRQFLGDTALSGEAESGATRRKPTAKRRFTLDDF